MAYVAWVYLLVFVALLILSTLFDITIYKRQWYTIWMLLLLAILCLSYCYAPFDEDDLVSYYQLLEDMRKNSLEWALFRSKYSLEMGSNILFVLVAKLTNWNQLLQIIFMGSLFIHIFLLCSVDKKLPFSRVSLLIYWLFFCAFFYVRLNLSNLRTPLAAAYFAYALQLELADSKNKKKFVCYYILAAMTHRVGILFILFRIAASCLNKVKMEKIAIVLCVWGTIPYLFVRFLYALPLKMTQDLAYKLSVYTSKANAIEAFDGRIKYVLIFTIFFLFVLLWWIGLKKNSYNINKDYFIYLKLAVYFMIGAIPYYTILDRTFRVFIVTLLPLWDTISYSSHKKTVFITKITGVILACGMTLYQIVYIYHHYSFR